MLAVCTALACGTSSNGSASSATTGGSTGGGQTTSSGGTSDSGNTEPSTDATPGTDTGTAEDTGAGSATDTGVVDVGTTGPGVGVVDAGTGGTVGEAGPFPGCSGWGSFTKVLIFDQWVWSGWQPSAAIGLTPDTCNLGDPLRPWETVTLPAGSPEGKCFVQHIDLATQMTGWGAVAWYHWNPGDEGYPDQGQRIKNPNLLSICSAKTVSFQVSTDVDGLVISFAAGDPSYEATSGDITLTANVWKQVTMTFSGWVQVPVARGFYWNVGYSQSALQGKTAFNFYLTDAKILP
jgi:hypothetical protein